MSKASLIKSKGIKRKVASVFASLGGVVAGIPGLDAIANVLGIAAGTVGGVGVAHAGVEGNLNSNYWTTMASSLATIFLMNHLGWIDMSAYFESLLHPILLTTAGIGVGKELGK